MFICVSMMRPSSLFLCYCIFMSKRPLMEISLQPCKYSDGSSDPESAEEAPLIQGSMRRLVQEDFNLEIAAKDQIFSQFSSVCLIWPHYYRLLCLVQQSTCAKKIPVMIWFETISWSQQQNYMKSLFSHGDAALWCSITLGVACLLRFYASLLRSEFIWDCSSEDIWRQRPKAHIWRKSGDGVGATRSTEGAEFGLN